MSEQVRYRFPDGGWCCTKPGVTEPCGDCDGCRYVASTNINREATNGDRQS